MTDIPLQPQLPQEQPQQVPQGPEPMVITLRVEGVETVKEWQAIQNFANELSYALEIFVERNRKYQDLWKVHGWMGTLHHIIHKSARLKRLYWDRVEIPEDDPDFDDLYDLINYTIFTILNLKMRNKSGAA